MGLFPWLGRSLAEEIDLDPLEIARAYAKAPRSRLLAYQIALEALDDRSIAGDVVECGVWQGGHAILSRLISPDRVNWLYDTFDGMPPPALIDGIKANAKFRGKEAAGLKWNAVSLAQVRGYLEEAGVLDETKLRFVAGDICETLRHSQNLPERIAMLRLDTDWHASTRDALRALYPRLAPGGVLMIDDYGHWPGCRAAVDRYFGAPGKLIMIDYTCGYLIKSTAA